MVLTNQWKGLADMLVQNNFGTIDHRPDRPQGVIQIQ
jgi:hypothetical protein